jgi:hypothetical protein
MMDIYSVKVLEVLGSVKKQYKDNVNTKSKELILFSNRYL